MFVESVLSFVLVFLLLLWKCQRKSDEPPGPVPFPILGNLAQLGWIDRKRTFIALDKLSKRYGDVMSVRLRGGEDVVILSSYEAFRYIMKRDAWSGKICSADFQDRYRKRNQRIDNTKSGENNACVDEARVLSRYFRDVGRPSKQIIMIDRTHEEVARLMENIDKNMGDGQQTILYMQHFFSFSFLNLLVKVTSGVKYKYGNRELKSLIDIVAKISQSESKEGGFKLGFPTLKKIVPKYFGNEKHGMDVWYNDAQKLITLLIDKDRRPLKPFPARYIRDALVQDAWKTKNDPHIDDKVAKIILELILAGSEPISNTMSFAILHLILNPDVQEKMYKEIIDFIGSTKLPEIEDKSNLPYTEAVLMEVQRISTVAPFSLHQELLEEIKCREVVIRKGTPIILNLYSINMNKNYWADPQQFRPERFLDSNNKILIPDYFMPFGVGEKSCIGEMFAKTAMFICLTTLVQNYKFETVPGHLNPTTEPSVGLTLSPEPYHAVITKRHLS